MNPWVHEMLDETVAELGVPPLAEAGTCWQAIFRPTFDPPCCLTVVDLGDVAELQVHGAGWRENVWLQPPVTIASGDARELGDCTGGDGRDGMVLRGRTGSHQFDVWTVSEPGAAHLRFFVALVDFARPFVTDPRSQRSLDRIRRELVG